MHASSSYPSTGDKILWQSERERQRDRCRDIETERARDDIYIYSLYTLYAQSIVLLLGREWGRKKKVQCLLLHACLLYVCLFLAAVAFAVYVQIIPVMQDSLLVDGCSLADNVAYAQRAQQEIIGDSETKGLCGLLKRQRETERQRDRRLIGGRERGQQLRVFSALCTWRYSLCVFIPMLGVVCMRINKYIDI